jgi:hypothetical protein
MLGAIQAYLYGKKRHSSGARSPRLSPVNLLVSMLPMFAGVFGLGLIGIVADPYDVRPWGMETKLADHRYPDVEWALLGKPVTQRPHKLALVGASTMMGVSTAQLEQAFGKETNPVNLSYPYAAPADTKETLALVGQMPKLERLILVVDHSQMMPMSVRFFPAQARSNVLSTNWAHAGDFTMDTAIASWNRAVKGTYDRAEWQQLKRPQFVSDQTIDKDPRAMARVRAAVQKYSADVLVNPRPLSCQDFPYINGVLLPALQQLSAKQVKVDVLFPPYLFVAYYDWIDRRFANDPFQKGPVYPSVIKFKQCIVSAVAAKNFPGVHITALDNDSVLAGDLSNFMDSIHIKKDAAFARILEKLASGQGHLTPANFDAFQRELEANIKGAGERMLSE